MLVQESACKENYLMFYDSQTDDGFNKKDLRARPIVKL